MSRVGKKSIPLPKGVTVQVENNLIEVTGPKGTLSQSLEHPIHIEVTEQDVFVSPGEEKIKNINAFWGLYRALIQNMVVGVTQGFEKKLRIEGIGYRVAQQGTGIVLNLGYSHPIEVAAPTGITFVVEKNFISVSGIDKALVGQTAANIRAKRPPEPYKGKGVRYIDEVVRMKVGKKASS